jgi:hypothetical protein
MFKILKKMSNQMTYINVFFLNRERNIIQIWRMLHYIISQKSSRHFPYFETHMHLYHFLTKKLHKRWCGWNTSMQQICEIAIKKTIKFELKSLNRLDCWQDQPKELDLFYWNVDNISPTILVNLIPYISLFTIDSWCHFWPNYA